MAKFEVSSKVSGLGLGVFDAEDEMGALDAAARDAGYDSFRDQCSITDPDDLDAEVEKCTDEMSVVNVTARMRIVAMLAAGVFHGDLCDAVREKFNCEEVEIDDEGNIWIAKPQAGHWLSADHVNEFADWADAMTIGIDYKFGTYDETVDGKKFRTIHKANCDSDAQAELEVKHIGGRDDLDLTNMDGDNLRGLYIRRGDAEWFVRF